VAVLGLFTQTANAATGPLSLGVAGFVNYGVWSEGGASGGLGFGGGLVSQFSFVEIDAFYNSRTIKADLLGTTISTSSGAVDLAALFRLPVAPMFSIGLGGTYSISTETGGSSEFAITLAPRFGIADKAFFEIRGNYFVDAIAGTSTHLMEVAGMLGFNFM
jgi:hypothetical protein